MSNSSFLSDQIKSSGKGIEEIYFRRNRIDRQFWRFDDSSVDLKFCDIRIMCVKCLNCLIWLKEFSQFRGKIQKCYIPNISDSNLRQSLSGSNNWIAFWNAFAKCISFCKSDFFFTFLTIYFLFPYYFWQQPWFYRYPPLSDKLNFFMIWMNSYSWVLICNFAVFAPFSTR